jgi:uncharacterized iron-regulated membrane protein
MKAGANLLVAVHRWAGLAIALVLVVAGLTGAILPYQRELSVMAAPDVWRVSPPADSAPRLSGVELMKRVEAETGGVVRYMPLGLDGRYAQAVFIGRRPDGPKLDYSEVAADPYTGAIRKRLRYGDIRQGAVNLMPFVMGLHYSLAAGRWGNMAFGGAALIWCVECLLGLALTFPKRVARDVHSVMTWLQRWGPSWRVRASGGLPLLLDLHRAFGLWLLPVMLVFAWSGVAFNLDQVHAPVQKLFGAQGLYRPPVNAAPDAGPEMTPEQALARGEALMGAEAARRGFAVRAPYAITWSPSVHAVGYYARTSLDGPTKDGSTLVWFDAASGRELEFRPPYGNTAADAFDKATRMLHAGGLFGWPYKVFVSFFGLATAGAAGMGCWLWLRRTATGSGRRSPGKIAEVAP